MPFFNQTFFKKITFISLVVGGLVVASAVYGLEVREIGVIQIEALNMRTGPGLDQPIIKVLKKDTQVNVLSHHKRWLRVSYDGDVGFIANWQKYVSLYTIHTVEDNRDIDIDSAREKASEIEEKIKDREAEISRYTRQERQVIEALDTTEQALVKTRRQLCSIQSEVAEVTQQIMKTRKQADELKKAVAVEKEYTIRRLIALYKMKRIGTMNLLASAESMHDLMLQKAAMTKILDYDQRLVADLLIKQHRLSKTIDALAVQKCRKSKLEAEYARNLAQLKQKKAKRERILSDIRDLKANRLTTLKYLKNAAARLDRTVADFQRRSAIQEDPSGESFDAYQGLLNIPVKGKIISNYGKYVEPRSGIVNFRNGIEIKSPRGAPFRAVFAGEAIYADWLTGYGNIIIIAHGNSYHTVYAHAEEIFLKKGSHVDAGDVIGTVGDSGTMSGTALYFEIRHHGDPVNPSEWIDNS